MSSSSRIIYTAAGEAPEVKLKDLQEGHYYLLAEKTTSFPHFFKKEDIKSLQTKPHKVKGFLNFRSSIAFILIFEDAYGNKIATREIDYPNGKETLFTEVPAPTGGKRKTTRKLKKSRKLKRKLRK